MSVVLKQDETCRLGVTFLPSEHEQPVEWNSSDTSVATVLENGKVTALKVGMTIVSASTLDNKLQDLIYIVVIE